MPSPAPPTPATCAEAYAKWHPYALACKTWHESKTTVTFQPCVMGPRLTDVHPIPQAKPVLSEREALIIAKEGLARLRRTGRFAGGPGPLGRL